MSEELAKSKILYLDKSQAVTDCLGDVTEVILIIAKTDVWAIDIAHGYSLMTELSDDASKFVALRGKLKITFAGFGHSYKQLSSVPQIVQYIKKLFKKWPYFLHFLSKENDNLTIFLGLLSETQQHDLGRGVTYSVISVNPAIIVELIENSLKLNNRHNGFEHQDYHNQLEVTISNFFPVSKYFG